jgi:hypothetical protein
MIKRVLTVSAVVLTLTGVTLAQQSGEEKKDASKQEMMQRMMKQKENSEGGMEGMGGMMGMMKMMEQCSRMMESGQPDSSKAKGSRM